MCGFFLLLEYLWIREKQHRVWISQFASASWKDKQPLTMLSWFKCTWQLVEIWQKKINIAEREINVCTKSVLMDCLINLWQQKMHFRIVILQAVNNHLPRDRRTLTHKIRWKKTMQFQVGISNKVSISLFPPKQHQKCPFYIVFVTNNQ